LACGLCREANELIGAIKTRSAPLDIKIISTGIKISDHHKRLLSFLQRDFHAPLKKRGLGRALREIASENGQAVNPSFSTFLH
jgi:hypothetical protein